MDKIPNILIVDDDKEICSLVVDALTEDGCICETAFNVHEALSKINNQRFDVALLDIKLPDESGMELLKKSQPFFHNTSIIMMTAVKDFNIAVQAMKMGATDYMVKPFTISQLTASITKALRDRNRYSLISLQTERMEYLYSGEEEINHSIKIINALAIGVDTQIDYFDFHSKRVTEQTVNLAHRIHLPEKEIKLWENMRNELISEKRRYMRTLLNKLGRSPLAQMMLGLTHLNINFPKMKGEQN